MTTNSTAKSRMMVARGRAMSLLVHMHRDDFDKLYAVEAAKVGVKPRGKRKPRKRKQRWVQTTIEEG